MPYLSPFKFGEKIAVSVLQTHRTHKPELMMSPALHNSIVNRQEAEAIAKAMAAVAPHGALDNTRVDLYGTQVKDLQQRMMENPRSAPYQRFAAKFDKIEGLPDKTQLLPDAYHPDADTVWLPSGNPGIMMHELGHSIDFNGYPNDTLRMVGAGLYRNLAPTIWTEHAAWDKGRHYFLEGAAQTKLPPELVVKTLRDATRAKYTGLGSYWGGGIGTLLGGGLGALGTYAAIRNGYRGRGVGLPLVLGLALGGAGGAMTGATLGNRYADDKYHDSPEAREKYLQDYADVYGRKHKLDPAAARKAIQALAEKLYAKKQTKKKKG